MKLVLTLSGENLELSKAEAEALFNYKFNRRSNRVYADVNISEFKIRWICNRSAMIKKACLNYKYIWKQTTGRFKNRYPKEKPYFHPTVLKPKLARTIINLSGIQKGRLLDPFCGTGSILIESAILGLNTIGIEISKKWAWYSRKNLEHYNLKAEVIIGDATNLSQFKPSSFDAIVTDPPYGRSSTLAGKQIKQLYLEFLRESYRILKKNKRLVMIRPNYLRFKIPKEWKTLGVYDWYVHKSLTRKIIILKKLNRFS